MNILEEELWSRSLWRNKDIDYIFGARIIEYDMKSAGLSLIKQYKLLPNEIISKLEAMTKHARDVEIGLIQRRDKEFSNSLGNAFREGRKLFFLANNLNEDKLISIKKDAFFTLDTYCHELEFDNIKYVEKNKYSSYIYINKLEFYFNSFTKNIDIKGLGQGEQHDEVIELHGDYMLDFLLKFVRSREINSSYRDTSYMLSSFIRDYKNKELPIGYYRHLDKDNSFLIWSEKLNEYLNVRETDEIEFVDIRPNYFDYLVPLVNIIV